MIVTVDLGMNQQIKTVSARFLTYKLKSIFLPTSVEFLFQMMGKNSNQLKQLLWINT